MKIEENRCEECEEMDSDQATNTFYYNAVSKYQLLNRLQRGHGFLKFY